MTQLYQSEQPVHLNIFVKCRMYIQLDKQELSYDYTCLRQKNWSVNIALCSSIWDAFN